MPDRIRLVYSEHYAVDIGDHVFPTSKYHQIKDRLLKESSFRSRIDFVMPEPASDEDLLLVHEKAYLEKLKSGTLTKDEISKLELPYSRELLKASLVCCGGTELACDMAISDRLGVHVGGGFHHAFQDHGEGFCVLNDVAVAVKRVLKNSLVKRVMIVDCDLHQGNGTATIFSDDPAVFTFSMHQENNYPFYKARSSLDIGLRDRAGDKEYLQALYEHLPKIVSDFKPNLLVYLAGADPYKDDRIGGLAISKEGLRKRDEFIFNQAVHYDTPISLVLAGGYAYDQSDTVDIHYNTIMAGLNIFYGCS